MVTFAGFYAMHTFFAFVKAKTKIQMEFCKKLCHNWGMWLIFWGLSIKLKCLLGFTVMPLTWKCIRCLELSVCVRRVHVHTSNVRHHNVKQLTTRIVHQRVAVLLFSIQSPSVDRHQHKTLQQRANATHPTHKSLPSKQTLAIFTSLISTTYIWYCIRRV